MENEQAYQEVDDRLRKRKKEKIALAKKKGYKYFSQYIEDQYGKIKYKKLAVEIKKETGETCSQCSLYAMIRRVNEKIKDFEVEEVVELKDRGMCRKCNKKKVAVGDGNYFFCRECHAKIKRADYFE